MYHMGALSFIIGAFGNLLIRGGRTAKRSWAGWEIAPPGNAGSAWPWYNRSIQLREAVAMLQLSVEEAESRFREILAKVEEGENVAITREGEPVAWLQPQPHPHLEAMQQAMDNAKRLRKKYSLQGLSIRELMNEGRR